MIILGIYYFSDLNNQEIKDFNKIHKLSQNLIQLWKEGDLENNYLNGSKSCEKIPHFNKISNSYLKCNSLFLDCFILHRENKEIEIKNLGPTQIEGGHYGFLFKLILNDTQLEIFLKDDCHEISLPRRWFGYSSYPKKGEDLVWNNFERKIVSDNRLVLNKDVLQWKKSLVPKKIMESYSTWHLPATYLKSSQMTQFCESRGKNIMNALIYDAFTFYPVYKDEAKKRPVYRAPNPWTLKYKNTFLKLKGEIKASHCAKAYTKDCKGLFPYEDYLQNSISWSGFFQSLGGPMEYMRNPISPKENVALSSYHFSSRSKVHELGIRGQWDGIGHERKNFKFDYETHDKNFEVGFRCFYYD